MTWLRRADFIWTAAIASFLVLIAPVFMVHEMGWEATGYLLVLLSPVLSLIAVVASWIAIRWGEGLGRPRALSVLRALVVAGLLWSAGLVVGPSASRLLGAENYLFGSGFGDWRTNNPLGWALVGGVYAILGVWALFLPPSRPGERRTRDVGWLSSALVAHVIVYVLVLDAIAPNETEVLFASLWEIPFVALLLAFEIPWRRLIRPGRDVASDPESAES